MERRVLIVDDDPLILALLRKQLRTAGYEVLSASNGIEALRILRNEGAQIVLSDWSMPQMDGLALCRAIRSEEGMGFIYIIVLTAHSDKDRVVEALGAGANDFLSKPFHQQELLARINAGMRIIDLEAELSHQSHQLHRANAEFKLLNEKLERMATTDDLTALPNRREAMNRLKKLWADSVRHNHPFSCIMADIDHFKQCNDTYGHDVGDLILQQTARVMERGCRSGDSVCRLGGEEFLILCPNTTAEAAWHAADRLRQAVAANMVEDQNRIIRVTLCLGVAERGCTSSSPDELLKRSDQAMYDAKSAGRNCVRIAPTEPVGPEQKIRLLEPPAGEVAETPETRDEPSAKPR